MITNREGWWGGGDIGLVVRSLEWGNYTCFSSGCIHINFIQKGTIIFVNINWLFLFSTFQLFDKNEDKFYLTTKLRALSKLKIVVFSSI